jgi:drug/metabolite transporter (DMT)-like permease
MTAVSILIALGAAFSFAVASVLQQRAASEVPDDEALGAGLIKRLLTRPMWLLGFLFDTLGYILQAVALIWGTIIVVQPILVTTLLFALPLGARFAGRKLFATDYAWAAVLSVSLVLFMVIGDPTEGVDNAPFRQWAIPLGAAGALVVACVVTGSRIKGPNRALLLAVSSGVLYGLTGALTKSVMDSFEDGIVDAIEPLFTNWETYALAVCITGGMFLQQSAYQAGNLAETLPAITVLEPVVAVILGLAILDERFTASGVLEWAVVAASAVGMTVATIELSRSSAKHDEKMGVTPG